MNLPADVCNEALDAIGSATVIGDPEEGTREAQVILRKYGQCMRQLLRGANWDFARATSPLTLLGDASGNTPGVGTLVAQPWTYCYQYPPDAAKVRFIPWNPANQAAAVPPDNIAIPSTPLMTGLGQQPGNCIRQVPARFVLATDPNYPEPAGQITWEVQGVSPQGRTVILTNVRYAQCIYTRIMLYPSVWDPLFRAAMVAYLASEIALPLWVEKDRAFGLKVRDEQIAIAKQKITEARLVDGNEGWSSSDLSVDWMQARNTGGAGWGANGPWGAGAGGWGDGCYGSFDQVGFGNGSAY